MLPDFPKVKQKIRHAINSYRKDIVRQDPIFSKIRHEWCFEGDKISQKGEKGEIRPLETVSISSEFEITRKEVILRGPRAYFEKVRNSAREIMHQQAKHMFNKMEEVTKEAGTFFDAKGRPLSFELLLEGLEKIQIDFDEQGHPRLPTLFVSPELQQLLQEKGPEWENNPEYMKRFEDIVSRKKKEWNDRESYRKLVD